MADKEKAIKVEREIFEYKGKSCYEYYISGVVRGREVKIKLAPPNANDRGGYWAICRSISTIRRARTARCM